MSALSMRGRLQKAFNGVLPPWIKPVKYIYSDGSQYIVFPNIVVKSTNIVNIDFEYIRARSARNCMDCVFGAGLAGCRLSLRVWQGYFGVNEVNDYKFRVDTSRHVFTIAAQEYWHNTEGGAFTHTTFSSSTVAQSRTGFAVFAIKTKDGIWTVDTEGDDFGPAVMKLYRMSYIDSDTSNALDMIPVYNELTNTAGLYDVLHDWFYESNVGSFGYETLDGTIVPPTTAE